MFCGITVSWNTTARRNVVGNPIKDSLTFANMLAVRIRLHGLIVRQCTYNILFLNQKISEISFNGKIP